MKAIEEISAKLSASHVISFENDGKWAGYSPSNGLYWVNGVNFTTPEAAAYQMILYPGNWREVEQCIDDDEEVA